MFYIFPVLLQTSAEAVNLILDASAAFSQLAPSALRLLQANFHTVLFVRDILCSFSAAFKLTLRSEMASLRVPTPPLSSVPRANSYLTDTVSLFSAATVSFVCLLSAPLLSRSYTSNRKRCVDSSNLHL